MKLCGGNINLFLPDAPIIRKANEMPMNKITAIFIAGFLFYSLHFSEKLVAQEIIPTYSDYLTDNLYLLHPSMAGAATINKIRLTARQQWLDVDDAPGLQTLSLHGRVTEKVGVGGILFNDHNGNFSKRGVYGSFAYHLNFAVRDTYLNLLSFGISGGLIQHNLDQSGFSGYDPLLNEENETDYYGNVDFGMSYYYNNFFTHLTVKNILEGQRELFISDAVPGNQRSIFFSTGYVIETGHSPWSLEPSILLQYRDYSAEKAVDLNFKAYYRGLEGGGIFGGISYRRGFEGAEFVNEKGNMTREALQYFTPFAGVQFKNFIVAYTYSEQFNDVVLSNGGFHQITLGYNFGVNRERHDCGCHNINHLWH